MAESPSPDAERQRLAELERYEILDTPPEATFDRVVAIVLAVFDVDFALITLVDRDRCWYKAETGLGVSAMPRADNMCDVVIRQEGVYVVNDARAARPEDVAPLLRMDFRFYIGAPLRTSAGIKVGTVCGVGREPREVTDAEKGIIEALAAIVSDELELRLAGRKAADAREKLAELNERLDAANRNKSEFLASMSHELRTPLNGILGASELLGQGLFGPLNEKQQEYVHDIYQSGTHLHSLINDVLDLSRIEAGQVELRRERIDVAGLMESCASVIRGLAAARSVMLDLHVPSTPLVVNGDERRLTQVACNLLSNAVKFTAERTTVGFAARLEGADVVFVVEDEGPGIPEEFHSRIFEQFFRLPGDHEGTGLGLPLARQLLELHCGRIWLEAPESGGSRFFFAVPAAVPG